MGRPVDPNAKNTVKLNVTNGYRYACTQPPFINPATGKKQYRRIHWGVVDDDLKFIPGRRFYAAPPEVRARLIFPEDWDLSLAERHAGLRRPPRPACGGQCRNLLYGDVWLLEQIARKTGVRQDLEAVFDRDLKLVDDIMTLAMYPYLTKMTYHHVDAWQAYSGAPSSRELTPAAIKSLTQSITEQHLRRLLELRAKRLGEEVDSTSRSAEVLADIKWGNNQDDLSWPPTTEVVVYSLTNHIPVYYRTLEGNIYDYRNIDKILIDSDRIKLKNLILTIDYDYNTLNNLQKFILNNQKLTICAKVNQQLFIKEIEAIGKFDTITDSMSINPETDIYYKQIDIDYNFKHGRNTIITNAKLKLNLYLEPVRKARQLMDLDAAIYYQKNALESILIDKTPLGDDKQIKQDYCYFNIIYDKTTRTLIEYRLDKKKIEKEKLISGFLAIITNKVDFDAIKIYEIYRLRDEQEKYFQQMKSQMVSDKQQNWSETGKTGRLLILFVSLILSSYLRHIWKSTYIHEKLRTSFDIILRMRCIRLIKHTNRAEIITPFVGVQVDICKAFEIDLPDGCPPA